MRPTSVEPVNDSLRTDGVLAELLADAASCPSTVMIVEHARRHAGALGQLGQRERGERRLRRRACTTTVQPAASAGPTLRVIIAFGKFQGVIAAHTPIGCLMTRMRLSGWWPGMVSP